MACRICNPNNKKYGDDASYILNQSDCDEEYPSDRECSGGDERGEDNRPRHRRRRSIRMSLQEVTMPTGESYRIKTPAIPNWQCENRARLINLSPRGRMGKIEYGIVAKQMQDTVQQHTFCETAGGCFKRYKIVKIQKIVNGCSWRRYKNRMDKMAQQVGTANERMLFHGTPNAYSLAAHGFDMRFANDGKLGTALYFAQHSSVANQFAFGFYGGDGCRDHKDKECYICVRDILLCRVTLGKLCQFENSSVGQMLSAPPGYQSVEGIPGTGGFKYPEFAVYSADQAYPEFLITYKIVKEHAQKSQN